MGHPGGYPLILKYAGRPVRSIVRLPPVSTRSAAHSSEDGEHSNRDHRHHLIFGQLNTWRKRGII
jgi:hypothetical protein